MWYEKIVGGQETKNVIGCGMVLLERKRPARKYVLRTEKNTEFSEGMKKKVLLERFSRSQERKILVG